jgi:dihydroorotate dehydrogenase (fumarate)
MDLTTEYLGLKLESPLMPGASPLADNLDVVRKLEDAGASAIVMHSLFEEQITREMTGNIYGVEARAESSAEALSYFPRASEFSLGPDEYLDQLRGIVEAVDVPVIGSLNGITVAGWLDYAKQIEGAGASALELNVYYLATNPAEDGVAVERRTLEIVRAVRAAVGIPIAVKLSPFFSALPHFVGELKRAGADGVVLFNRFYQPDIDAANLEASPTLRLSEMERWLAEHEYESLRQMRGNMSLARCPDPNAFSRANYLRILQGWRLDALS